MKQLSIQNRLAIIIALALLPLVVIFTVMQFSAEVNWSLFDFVVAGGLLFSTGLACEWALRKAKTPRMKLLLIAAVILGFLMVWVELAVGVFGSPFAGS